MSSSLPALVVAVILLGLAAGVASTTIRSSETARLDSAAHELASLFRQTQREAMRTGIPHGVVFDPTDNSFTASQLSTVKDPFDTTEPAYHTLSKQPLVWRGSSLTISPTKKPFIYVEKSDANDVMFDSWGTPVRYQGNELIALDNTSISLGLNDHERRITIDHLTGRVKVI